VTRRTLTIPESVDLKRTVGGLKEMARVISPSEAWWVARTPDGPGTLRLQRTAPDRLETEAWGPGAVWMQDRAALVSGAEDDLNGFEPHHDVMAKVIRQRGIHRFGRTDRIFDALVPAILGQKVQTQMARRSWRGILRRFGEAAPGPIDLRVHPPPERFAEVGYAALHQAGVERKRATVILRAAKLSDRLERAAEGDDRTRASARVDRFLRSIPGIGPWTSSFVRTMAMGDADAVLVGDFHLPHTVSWALAGEPRGDDARMLELLEPYAGHRARAQRMLKLGGIRAPRYGPRLAFHSIDGL
jgi:3-methyladenine DNA glycosylase/8-oxoguanine DNA glycosylase